MAALAKNKIHPWPYPGPIALVERDEFGMREDFHVVDAWRYLGTAHDEATLHSILENRAEDPATVFDADIYRIVGKYLKDTKTRVMPLTRP